MTPTEFTPLSGLLGGALIGLASAAVALALGRIAGISGIFAGTLWPTAGDWSWRALFSLGLVLGAFVTIQYVDDAAAYAITPSTSQLVVGGLLVGFGTGLGSGCTSGHGVCGLSRGSRRSLVAVPVFMASGIATVALMRLWGIG